MIQTTLYLAGGCLHVLIQHYAGIKTYSLIFRVSLGQHVTVMFRFRISVTAKPGRLMHIVSNCCTRCDREPEPSLDIGIIPGENGGIGVFSIRTKEAGEVFMFVPYQDTVSIIMLIFLT